MSKIENTDGMIDQVEESGDGEWLDKYKTIKLPFEYTSKKNHQVVFEYLTEESLPVMYEIIQRVGKDAEGINPEDFHPLEKLRRTVLPSIKKKLAFQMTDMKDGRAVGMYYIHPSPMCRSASPVMNCGYGIMDLTYQDSGIGNISGTLYCLMARKAGFLGLVARAGVQNPKSYIAQVAQGCSLPGYIPDSCKTPLHGWTADYIIHIMYNQNNKQAVSKISAEEAIKRALRATKPTRSQHPTYEAMDKHCNLQDGSTARIRSTNEQCDIQKAFDILSQAAYQGSTFAIDEFPSLEIFMNSFLDGRQLIIIEKEQDTVVGVGILGTSHICRSSTSPNAVIYLYLLPQFRGQGYGKLVFSFLEKHATSCGFSAVLVDAFYTKDFPNKFMANLGYRIVGSIPYSGYVKGQGWTDAILFYKRIVESHL